jgi:hypothetical protein
MYNWLLAAAHIINVCISFVHTLMDWTLPEITLLLNFTSKPALEIVLHYILQRSGQSNSYISCLVIDQMRQYNLKIVSYSAWELKTFFFKSLSKQKSIRDANRSNRFKPSIQDQIEYDKQLFKIWRDQCSSIDSFIFDNLFVCIIGSALARNLLLILPLQIISNKVVIYSWIIYILEITRKYFLIWFWCILF